jgi:hypothetical protein
VLKVFKKEHREVSWLQTGLVNTKNRTRMPRVLRITD